MFTGLIEEIGKVKKIESRGMDIRLCIESGEELLEDASLGESIAVSGVCLTVTDMSPLFFWADVSVEDPFCDAAMEFRHSSLKGSLCCIFITACNGFLDLAYASPNTADTRAISRVATFRLTHAFACRNSMSHSKT